MNHLIFDLYISFNNPSVIPYGGTNNDFNYNILANGSFKRLT